MKILTAGIFTVLLASVAGAARADIASTNFVTNKTGDLTTLSTTAKDNLVNAINELDAAVDTKADSSKVTELEGKIGGLTGTDGKVDGSKITDGSIDEDALDPTLAGKINDALTEVKNGNATIKVDNKNIVSVQLDGDTLTVGTNGLKVTDEKFADYSYEGKVDSLETKVGNMTGSNGALTEDGKLANGSVSEDNLDSDLKGKIDSIDDKQDALDAGDGIDSDALAENKVQVKAKADGGIIVATDGISVNLDKVAEELVKNTKVTEAIEGAIEDAVSDGDIGTAISSAVTGALDNLDLPEVKTDGQAIISVSQANGVVTATAGKIGEAGIDAETGKGTEVLVRKGGVLYWEPISSPMAD